MSEGNDIALALERIESEIARLKKQLSTRDDVRFSGSNVNSHAIAREIYELDGYKRGFLDGQRAAIFGRPPLVFKYGLPYRRKELHLSDLKASFGRYNLR